jgi:hypothetical protein
LKAESWHPVCFSSKSTALFPTPRVESTRTLCAPVHRRTMGMAAEVQPQYSGSRSEGRYANYFEVGHNAFEFVLDFGQFYPCAETPQFHTRIVTSPTYAKALLDTLANSLRQFEEEFGRIADAR